MINSSKTIELKIDPRSDKVLIEIANIENRNKRALWAALLEVGSEVEKEIKRLITNGPKTGRLYKLPGGGWHQASAPGEAPANRTGTLKASTGFNVRNWREVVIGEHANHAKMEHNWGRIKARPHIIKAVQNKGWEIVQIIEQRLKKEMTH